MAVYIEGYSGDKIKKTNISILDKSLWNWVKDQKNRNEVRSTSDILFKFIKYAKINNVGLKMLLRNLEKYYEYSYFDMEELSHNLNLPSNIIIEQIKENIGEIPLYGSGTDEEKKSARKKIHNLMVDNDIIPRELHLAFKLRDYPVKRMTDDIKKSDFNDYSLLEVFYPDRYERQRELYNYTILFTEFILTKCLKKRGIEDLNCNGCKRFKGCNYSRPDLMYYQAGVDIKIEDIENDLIFNIIKTNCKNNHLHAYGLILEMAMGSLIMKNLRNIEDFLKEELLNFPKPTEEVIEQITINITAWIEENQEEHGDFLNMSQDSILDIILDKNNLVLKT